MSLKTGGDIQGPGIGSQGSGDGETGRQGVGVSGRGSEGVSQNSELRTQNVEPVLSPQSPVLSPAKAHRRPPRPVIALVVLTLAVTAYWYYTESSTPISSGITASGTIESEEVSVASEVAGRIVQINADEGDPVSAGQTLVKLDDSTLQLQYRMASSLAEQRLLEAQIDKTSIRSPLDGVVVRRSLRVGEVASPGVSIMTVTQTDPVELTIYVPESQIGRVKVGQKVDVRVDSFPGDVFPGEVTFISSKAEFTPRNVQTQKDRMSLVFAVKVRIPNADQRLKPGMPADATIVGVGG